MNTVVKVELGHRAYPIHIGAGLLSRSGELCAASGLSGRCLVVSDANVAPLYAKKMIESLRAAGFMPELAVLPAGEPTKSRENLFDLYDRMFEHGMDRKSFVVALGGGVIGDLAGYAAASFLRGIRFVQIPTSLLAMVDSSVGGKTAINVPQGKNLIGAFHQPSLVLADTDTLATLKEREYRAGMAEVVKYGPIWSADFFAALEEKRISLPDIVARCCAIKAQVVREDEHEGGLRAILNFGHTLAHSIEKCAGYGQWLHGEAVAVGMVFAARLSVLQAGLHPEDAGRLENLLVANGLPVRAPDLDWVALRAALKFDKKTEGGVPRFVLVGPLGRAHFGCEVSPDRLEKVWREMHG